MMKKIRNACTSRMVTAAFGAPERGGASTRVLNSRYVATRTRVRRRTPAGAPPSSSRRRPHSAASSRSRKSPSGARRSPAPAPPAAGGTRRPGHSRFLRSVFQGVEARLELVHRRVELLLELVARLEIGRAEVAELGDEVRGRVRRVAELVAERVGRERLAAGVGSDAIDSRQSERLVHTEPAHSSVVGGPSSLSRIATAAMTIAAIPMPIAAMNQFLRTERRV